MPKPEQSNGFAITIEQACHVQGCVPTAYPCFVQRLLMLVAAKSPDEACFNYGQLQPGSGSELQKWEPTILYTKH
jgi:hypothetical protein